MFFGLFHFCFNFDKIINESIIFKIFAKHKHCLFSSNSKLDSHHLYLFSLRDKIIKHSNRIIHTFDNGYVAVIMSSIFKKKKQLQGVSYRVFSYKIGCHSLNENQQKKSSLCFSPIIPNQVPNTAQGI